jgi:nitrate/nitrite transporter NarK
MRWGETYPLRSDHCVGGSPANSAARMHFSMLAVTLPHAPSSNVKVWRRTADNCAVRSHSVFDPDAGVEKAAWSRSSPGALIGFAGAIGALGGVFINVVLRASYVGAAKSATNAFWVFMAFYVLCAIVTWFVFLRIQTARVDAGEEIGRTVAPVPAT